MLGATERAAIIQKQNIDADFIIRIQNLYEYKEKYNEKQSLNHSQIRQPSFILFLIHHDIGDLNVLGSGALQNSNLTGQITSRQAMGLEIFNNGKYNETPLLAHN